MTVGSLRTGLSCRAFRDDDLLGVLALWDNSGWGALDEATWKQWYRDTPHGDSPIWVMESAGDIVAQLVFTPGEVEIGGALVKSLRSSAAILHPHLRHAPLDGQHPLVRIMAQATADIVAEGTYAVGYGFPHPVMFPLSRYLADHEILPVQLSTFGCRVVHATHNTAASEFDCSVTTALTDEHESLARCTPRAFGVDCYVRRSLPWMKWRIGGDRIVEVRTTAGELVAFAAVRGRDHLVSDIHVRDASYVDALLSAAALLSRDLRAGVPALPVLLPALERLQAAPAPARLAFTCCTYDEQRVPSQEIAPERWFPMQAD